MITKKRLKNIKENVYMRSEIAKISRIGIDTSLKEELELIEEIERLNNIIKELEKDLEGRYYGRGKYYMDSDVIGIKEVISKIKQLKENK